MLDPTDFDDVPPYSGLQPEQIQFLSWRVDSSALIIGDPYTRKTSLALWKAKGLVVEGKSCLYIGGTSLSLKFVKHAAVALGLCRLQFATFYEVASRGYHCDVIILDDSQLLSIEQIQAINSLAGFLLLFGDYSHFRFEKTESETINSISETLGCRVFSFSNRFSVYSSQYNFCQLIPRLSNTIYKSTKFGSPQPIIAQIGSIEKQCTTIIQLVNGKELDNVGILCLTRNMVESAYSIFKNHEFSVEAYLPGREKGIDTIDLSSTNPKITTVASSVGTHFDTLFLIGLDSFCGWNNLEDVFKIAVTRALEELYVFYDKQLPEFITSLPKSRYRPNLYNPDIVLF